MTMAEKTVNICVIIVEVELGGEKVVMGAMVQEVLDGPKRTLYEFNQPTGGGINVE